MRVSSFSIPLSLLEAKEDRSSRKSMVNFSKLRNDLKKYYNAPEAAWYTPVSNSIQGAVCVELGRSQPLDIASRPNSFFVLTCERSR